MKKSGRGVGLVAAGLVVALWGTGCKGEDPRMDLASTDLVNALFNKDRDSFKGLVSEGLDANVGEARFLAMSNVVHRLGGIKGRERLSLEGSADEVQKGRYRFDFIRGSANMEVTLVKGRVVAFDLEGEGIEMARKEVAGDSFTASAFHFVDDKGRPHDRVFALGTPVRFSVEARGLGVRKGTHWLRGDLEVIDTDRKRVVFAEDFVKSRPKAGKVPVATVTGEIAISKPGKYQLTLSLRDRSVKRKKGEKDKVVKIKKAFKVE